MKIELKKEINKTKINVGDAIVFNSGIIRIIVETPKGYGAYGPVEDKVYYGTCDTIAQIINSYDENDIERIINKDNLKIVEI